MPRWGVQVALGDQVLQQVDQRGARVGAGVEVDHIVGAAELEKRLRLKQTTKAGEAER